MSDAAVAKKTKRALSVPSTNLAALRARTISVMEAIGSIETPREGANALAAVDAIKILAERLNADTETLRLVQKTRFAAMAKIGELAEKSGLGMACPSFDRRTLYNYRRVYLGRDGIEAYFSGLAEEEKEPTLSGFLGFVKQSSAPAAAASSPPETFRNIHNCRGLLIGSGWWRHPTDHARANEFAENLRDWNFKDWFDDRGSLLAIRTLNRKEAQVWADVLIATFGFERLPWQIALTGVERWTGAPWEEIVIGTRGDVDVDRLPARGDSLCPCKVGPEATIRQWLAPGDGQGPLIELGASEKHDGFLCLTTEGEVLS